MTTPSEVPPEVTLESSACPLGCGRNDEFVVEGFDRLHNLPGRFKVVRCTGCGLMRTDPRPTPETIGFYYPSDYGPYQYTRVGERTAHVPPSPIRALLSSRADALPPLRPGRMLEIGCASGAFMHRMASEGWSVQGVEFSEVAAASARSLGFDVFAGRIEDAPEPEQKFDLVVAWMALEHFYQPIEVMKRLKTWIEPHGRVVLSVPNASSAEFRIFGNAWYALQLPTHLFHFTPTTLAKTLAAAGWRVDKTLHQRTVSNLAASVGYRMRDRNGNSKLATRLVDFPETGGRLHDLVFPAAVVLAALGQTGRMTVWAAPEW